MLSSYHTFTFILEAKLLLRFLVCRVFLAELAVLFDFKSVRIVFLVLGRIVVTLFTFRASQSNIESHLKHLL